MKKQKCSKYFIFLITMATKVGGVARYEKKPIFWHFRATTAIPSAYIETYTVNGKFKMVLAFIKHEIMRRFHHLLVVTMETIRVLSQNRD